MGWKLCPLYALGNAVVFQPSFGAPPDGTQVSATVCQNKVSGCPNKRSVPFAVNVTLGDTWWKSTPK